MLGIPTWLPTLTALPARASPAVINKFVLNLPKAPHPQGPPAGCPAVTGRSARGRSGHTARPLSGDGGADRTHGGGARSLFSSEGSAALGRTQLNNGRNQQPTEATGKSIHKSLLDTQGKQILGIEATRNSCSLALRHKEFSRIIFLCCYCNRSWDYIPVSGVRPTMNQGQDDLLFAAENNLHDLQKKLLLFFLLSFQCSHKKTHSTGKHTVQ